MVFYRAIVLLMLFFSPLPNQLLFAQYNSGQWIGEVFSVPHKGPHLLKGTASVLVDKHNNIQKIIENLSEANVPLGLTFVSHDNITNYVIWNNLYNMMNYAPQWHDGAFYAIACGVGIFGQPSAMGPNLEYVKSHEVLTSQILNKPLEPDQTRSFFVRENGARFNRWFFAKQKYEVNDDNHDNHEVNDDNSDNEWQYLGYFDDDPPSNRITNGLNIIPCDGDRFIVVSQAHDLSDRDRQDRSPFSRLSLPLDGHEEFRVTASIDHGQDELRPHMSNPQVFRIAYRATENIALTEKHATLVDIKTGLYWVFSREKATLVRAGNIFKKVTTEHIINDSFERAIFCVHPEKDGTVLISAEDEDYLITGKVDITKEFMELQLNGFFSSPEKALEWYSERQKENQEQNQFLVWYRIYPESGKVEKLPVPPEGGSELKYIDGKSATRWIPMPDGSVKRWADIFSGLDDKIENRTIETKQQTPENSVKKPSL